MTRSTTQLTRALHERSTGSEPIQLVIFVKQDMLEKLCAADSASFLTQQQAMLVRGTKDRERYGRCTQAIDCLGDLVQAGIIDPVKVSYSAVRNAASVAGSILTTQTVIAKKFSVHALGAKMDSLTLAEV